MQPREDQALPNLHAAKRTQGIWSKRKRSGHPRNLPTMQKELFYTRVNQRYDQTGEKQGTGGTDVSDREKGWEHKRKDGI